MWLLIILVCLRTLHRKMVVCKVALSHANKILLFMTFHNHLKECKHMSAAGEKSEAVWQLSNVKLQNGKAK